MLDNLDNDMDDEKHGQGVLGKYDDYDSEDYGLEDEELEREIYKEFKN